jgi:hypothetical protein
MPRRICTPWSVHAAIILDWWTKALFPISTSLATSPSANWYEENESENQNFVLFCFSHFGIPCAWKIQIVNFLISLKKRLADEPRIGFEASSSTSCSASFENIDSSNVSCNLFNAPSSATKSAVSASQSSSVAKKLVLSDCDADMETPREPIANAPTPSSMSARGSGSGSSNPLSLAPSATPPRHPPASALSAGRRTPNTAFMASSSSETPQQQQQQQTVLLQVVGANGQICSQTQAVLGGVTADPSVTPSAAGATAAAHLMSPPRATGLSRARMSPAQALALSKQKLQENNFSVTAAAASVAASPARPTSSTASSAPLNAIANSVPIAQQLQPGSTQPGATIVPGSDANSASSTLSSSTALSSSSSSIPAPLVVVGPQFVSVAPTSLPFGSPMHHHNHSQPQQSFKTPSKMMCDASSSESV